MFSDQRVPQWRMALCQFLGEVARRPLVFGQHDCALFAADAVAAMTGVDLAVRYRGRYSTLAGGLRLLARDGFQDHVELARGVLPVVPVSAALPGDLAVIPAEPVRALGVVQGASVYVLSPDGILGLVPLTTAVEVFRV